MATHTSPRLIARWLLSALAGAAPIWLGGALAVLANGPVVAVLVVMGLCGALAQYWVLERPAAGALLLYVALGKLGWTVSFMVSWAFLLAAYAGGFFVLMVAGRPTVIGVAILAALSAAAGALLGFVVGLLQRAALRRRGLLVPLEWCWRRVRSWTFRAAIAVGWAGLAVAAISSTGGVFLAVSGPPVAWLLGALLDAGDLVLPVEAEST